MWHRLNFIFSGNNEKNDSNSDETDKDAKSDDKEEENKSQPWYFHVVASVILVVHGLTFLGKSANNWKGNYQRSKIPY